MMSESPSGPPGSVKIVDFTLFGQPFRAMSAGPHHEFNDAVSMVVQCEDQAELDRYWNALLDGGGRPQACGCGPFTRRNPGAARRHLNGSRTKEDVAHEQGQA
jgi:predicted 3-demethylubiquinone-9 3-methyltransferase (glyoxalase superfamily)